MRGLGMMAVASLTQPPTYPMPELLAVIDNTDPITGIGVGDGFIAVGSASADKVRVYDHSGILLYIKTPDFTLTYPNTWGKSVQASGSRYAVMYTNNSGDDDPNRIIYF